MSTGDLDLKFEDTNIREIRQLGNSVNMMKDNLLEQNRQLEYEKSRIQTQEWIKGTLANFFEDLQGQADLTSLAQEFLNIILPKINGIVATVYLKEAVESGVNAQAKEKFSLFGSYSFSDQSRNQKDLELIIKECRQSEHPIYLEDFDNEQFSFRSTIGPIRAKSLVIAHPCSNATP